MCIRNVPITMPEGPWEVQVPNKSTVSSIRCNQKNYSSENLCYFFLSKTAKKIHFHRVKFHHWEDEVADLRILRLNVKNPPTHMQKFRNKHLMQIMEEEGYGYTFYLQDCKAKYSTVLLWKYMSIVSIFRRQNRTNTRKMS
jgi:hypothetical protein